MTGAKSPGSRVAGLRLTVKEAEGRIHEKAKITANIILGDHAVARMEERGITDAWVYDVLRTGAVVDPPTKTKFGEWQCKLVKRMRGSRDVGVITIILHSGKLFVKTVEWEDLK